LKEQNRNKINDNRKKIVHVAFAKDEKESIIRHAKSSKMTISEFIRQGVFDKIRRIENPDLFNQNSNQFNTDLLRRLLENVEDIAEQKKFESEQTELSYKMEKLQNTIQAVFEDVPRAKKKILNLLRVHKALYKGEIMEYTDLSRKTVIKVLSNPEFKLNIDTGKFELRESVV